MGNTFEHGSDRAQLPINIEGCDYYEATRREFAGVRQCGYHDYD